MDFSTRLDSETLDKLQSLIQINIDSRDGLLEAMENTPNREIKDVFRDLATVRNRQATELSSLIAANHERPSHEGTLKAAIHRVWLDLRAVISSGPEAIVNEAARGEAFMRDTYEQILAETAGSAVSEVLKRHYRDLNAAHERIQRLREVCESQG